MSRLFYIFLSLCTLLPILRTEAQTIAIGERTPRIKHCKWLNGNVPEQCDFVYIEFIHSASTSCRNTAERLHNVVNEIGNIAFVLISHQSASEIDDWVVQHIDKRSGVIVDDTSIRHTFGVNYAPYSIIIDQKRRALWFGNPQLLDKKAIEKLIHK
ncbi:MAG: hypothetical protein II214_01560 [Alistipes sp.]|nr:hypothetical protein [Alistipes sp.]